MTSPIRPGFTPVQTPQPSAARADARAAQRAFFQQALGEARANIGAPQSPAPTQLQPQPAARAQPVAAPEPVRPAVQTAATPAPARAEANGQPQRLLRPGSLLDIRV
ncbi:hypothetical protein [Caulobacter sp. 17J80-11]|uniref:hypothetical protein n=1 Tax=Caulobacter sp. 17J80-11 TaxID=2763502 RepID=UPI0016537D24|nr:hypothetical protein [Caulobacter sp. 17J80-11]MBC6983195.1 hypothetical protein [Caulobacter sp. 17J80-11]